jgi:hypothetical protein
MLTAEEALEKVIRRLDSIIAEIRALLLQAPAAEHIQETEMCLGFPERILGEIVF